MAKIPLLNEDGEPLALWWNLVSNHGEHEEGDGEPSSEEITGRLKPGRLMYKGKEISVDEEFDMPKATEFYIDMPDDHLVMFLLRWS